MQLFCFLLLYTTVCLALPSNICPVQQEGQCLPCATPSQILICASGIWQQMPQGSWECREGDLIPKITDQCHTSDQCTDNHLTDEASESRTSSQPSLAASHELADFNTIVGYEMYVGDGSAAQGWPDFDQWLDFERLFEINKAAIDASCYWNEGLEANSVQETEDLKSAIKTAAIAHAIDARFILAIVMQESHGCVRVHTTRGAHDNPGLMQSYMGTGTCNTNRVISTEPGFDSSGVQAPCPSSTIHQMVVDGTAGTVHGSGLVQILAQETVEHSDISRWYRTARVYNSGSVDVSGQLEVVSCCTASYARDIANRLRGWTGDAQAFSGWITTYEPGPSTSPGACGSSADSADYVAAISWKFFTSENSNADPYCDNNGGRKIRASYKGKEVMLKVIDRCQACGLGDLDLALSPFNDLTGTTTGKFAGVRWEFV